MILIPHNNNKKNLSMKVPFEGQNSVQNYLKIATDFNVSKIHTQFPKSKIP
ncbi:unnamed protein product [Larinioides sclopetarius]|uniref:Uncharacterized protein n=1 Tax=Larinioides sclopetarius TaxID=280406 RepID=A0AAV2BL46_9ARAC